MGRAKGYAELDKASFEPLMRLTNFALQRYVTVLVRCPVMPSKDCSTTWVFGPSGVISVRVYFCVDVTGERNKLKPSKDGTLKPAGAARLKSGTYALVTVVVLPGWQAAAVSPNHHLPDRSGKLKLAVAAVAEEMIAAIVINVKNGRSSSILTLLI